jgi:hypothetical protein
MPDTSWTTRHEINFIKHLGTGKFSKESAAVKECSRSELLLRYLKGAEARTRWDGIDQAEVIRFATACIRTELPN